MDSAETAREAEIKRFLFREMGEEENFAFEERLLLEDELNTEVATVERDLLDAWARGQLEEKDSRRLEASLLHTAAGRLRAETAQILAEREAHNTRKTVPRRQPASSRSWALAALLSAAVLGLGWFWRHTQKPHDGSPTETVVWLSMESPRATEAPSQRFHLPTQAEDFLLLVDLEGVPFEGPYRVRLQDAEGLEVFRAEALSPVLRQNSPAISLEIPTTQLLAAEYVLLLSSEDSERPLEARFRLLR